MAVIPTYDLQTCPKPDIIVIPGANPDHIMKYIQDKDFRETVLKWIKNQYDTGTVVFTVCTGSMLLSGTGILAGHNITTHSMLLDVLEQHNPEANVIRNVRYIDQEQLITTAGITAGIDAALYLIGKHLGQETVDTIVKLFEYQNSKADVSMSKDEVYDIQDSIMIRTRDGALLSAIVVRKKSDTKPKPVILQFTIYVRDKDRDLQSLKDAADRDYIGVIAYTRGKRYSPNKIYPYETDGNDTYDVIDWINKQSWCNGSVGMYGGSYNGFTQWAATKKVHPALKTIVPYVANRPGMGLPMENNIFINPNYEWSFYVSNNKYLDTETGNNRNRFRAMMFKWWESGAAYKKMDSIDGTPNRLFQRWISHPDFDDYWQKMAPYKEDFAQIRIPVLAFDGYYNDSQNSSLYYLRELNKYSPDTPVYLMIGPYGHFGTQVGGEEMINGYKIDSVARFNIKEYTYQWFNFILKGDKKPDFLRDKINYQVIGTDQWRSAPSLDAMHNTYLKLYLSKNKSGKFYSLSSNQSKNSEYFTQEVDFSDRKSSNNDYYPDPIVRDNIDDNGFVFVTEPFKEPFLINGSFLGQINLICNKKDLDIGLTLYEVTAE
ncbi:hypothetical protein SOVF_210430, partial [Spinacia oleracea]